MIPSRVFCSVSARLILGVAIALPAVAAANAAADDVVAQGEITAVDLSAMAFDGPAVVTIRTAAQDVETISVPAQGRNLCAARDRLAAPEDMSAGELVSVRGTRSADGAIVPCDEPGHALHLMSRQSMPEHGYQFEFRKAPAGYVVTPHDTSESPDFIFGISLISRDDLDALSDAAGPRDGPKAISLQIYRNTGHLHAPVWVDRNASLSPIDLARGPVEEAVLGGANAVRYRTDGLYQNEHFAVAHDSKIFLWTVMYDSPDDDIYRDFSDLMATFEFIPPE